MKKFVVIAFIVLCGFLFSAQPVHASTKPQYIPPPIKIIIFTAWWLTYFPDLPYDTAWQVWEAEGEPSV